MRAAVLALSGVLAIGLAAEAMAQARQYTVTVAPTRAANASGYQKMEIKKAAIGSAKISLWNIYAVNPDCTPHDPGPTLTISQPPEHGTANIDDSNIFPNFPQTNSRSVCNTQQVPGLQAFYTANGGYRGSDRMVLLAATADGAVRQITVNIDVH
jgi:hypothetical protein